MKQLVLVLAVFTFGLSVLAKADSVSNTHRVWIFAIFSPEVMQFKTQAYFEYLSDETGKRYQVVASQDVTKLISQCQSSPPEIVMLSKGIAQSVIDLCDYTSVAKTYQRVVLFTPKANNPEITEVRRVGVIKNVWATLLAQEELPSLIPSVDFKEYPGFYEMLLSAKNDDLDAIVIPDKIFAQARLFEQGWRESYQLKGRGEALVLLSNRLDQPYKNQLTSILLDNGPISTLVWQSEVGLGEFVPSE